ncbi:hypothetical protein IFM89_019166 [Coptis chinensis]|uniref:Uncharacterized protein n=1 Tax=Coptis chinensis TaxID=261450 RepID=A0A835GY95_9MAGN|nr:hypothetical protein IFM89_019166 [Coptis chinensis]
MASTSSSHVMSWSFLFQNGGVADTNVQLEWFEAEEINGITEILDSIVEEDGGGDGGGGGTGDAIGDSYVEVGSATISEVLKEDRHGSEESGISGGGGA